MRVDFDLIVRITKTDTTATGPAQSDELVKATLAGPRVAVEKVLAAIKQVAELI